MTPEELSETKSNKPGRLRSIVCVALAILGTAYALWLRMNGLISTEAALFGFTCLFIFVAIVVYVLPQLQELNLKELKVVLREIKETENRIYVRAEILRKLSLRLADILVIHSLNIGRLAGEEYTNVVRAWQSAQLEKVLELVEATPEEKLHLMRFARRFEAIDPLYKQPRSDERDKLIEQEWKKVQEQFKQESS